MIDWSAHYWQNNQSPASISVDTAWKGCIFSSLM